MLTVAALDALLELEAPAVNEGVGVLLVERLAVAEPIVETEADTDTLALPETPAVPDKERDVCGLADPVNVRLDEDCADWLRIGDRDAEAVVDLLEMLLAVGEIVEEMVRLPSGWDGEGLGELEGVPELEKLPVPDTLAEGVTEVPTLTEGVTEAVPCADGRGEEETVLVARGEGDALALFSIKSAEAIGEPDEGALEEGLRDTVLVLVSFVLEETLGEVIAVREGRAEIEGLPESEVEMEKDGENELVVVGEAEPVE